MQSELKDLIKKKDQLQKQICQLNSQIQLLDETKNFNKGLVDVQGFPRSDLDFGEIANYRSLKKKRAELNNDHLALMKQIEQDLFKLHATYPTVKQEYRQKQVKQKPYNFKKNEKIEKYEQKKEHIIEYLTPFAKISHVEIGSPAENGGLKIGDLISEFGDIHIYTIDNIKQIASRVKQNIPIKVIVMRQFQIQSNIKLYEMKDNKKYAKIEIVVVPSHWEGRGLLGCKIDPL